MVGTSNETELLNDPTGNRRFWIIPVIDDIPIDIEQLVRERDFIWAAANALYEKGHQWWPGVGEPGTPGEPGPPGEPGQPGQQGEKGEKGEGEQGEKGKEGEKGEKGEKGEEGEKGKEGEKGEKGDEAKVEFTGIDVKCFDKCNVQTRLPEFINKSIQVIKGTESQEKLNFEQIANTAALSCFQLVEIEIKTFDSCDPDTHKPVALKEPKKIKVLPGMQLEVKAIFDQMFEIQGEQCDIKPNDMDIVEISVQTVIGCNQDRTPIFRDRTIHCPKRLESWLIYEMRSLANIESKLCLITGEVGDVGGNILNEVRVGLILLMPLKQQLL